MNITLRTSLAHINLNSLLYATITPCESVYFLFPDGNNVTIRASEPDYPAALFWMLFWSDKTEGQVVDIEDFYRNTVRRGLVAAEHIARFEAMLP